MQRQLLGDEQYVSTRSEEGFDPVDVVDLVPEIEAENTRQNRAMDVRIQGLKANDDRRVKIAEQENPLQELAAFSETLTNTLVDIQDKKNKAEMQRGLMLDFTEGVTAEEQAEFEATEAEHRAVATETDRAAEEIEEQTGDVFVADRVRSMSDWERYGYLKGRVQRAAANYPAFLAAAKDNVSVVVDGKTVTYENANTPEEFAALQSEVSSMYIEQFAGVNPALLNKYLFAPIQQQNATEAIEFAEGKRKEREQQRATDRANQLLLDIDTKQPDTLSNFVLNHPKGAAAGKRELAALLDAGLKNGTISGEYVLTTLFNTDITFRDGSVGTLAGKDPAIFGGLEKLANDAIAGRIEDETRDERLKQQDTINELTGVLTGEGSDGVVTEQERELVYQTWKDRHPGVPFPDDLKDLFTADETFDVTEANIRIKAIFDERGYLTDEDLERYPASIKNAWKDYVKDPDEVTPSRTQNSDADAAIKAALYATFEVDEGSTPKGADLPLYERMRRNAKADYERLYATYRADGLSEKQAHEAAIEDVGRQVGVGVKSSSYANSAAPSSAEQQSTADRVNLHREIISNNPDAAKTEVFLSPTEQQEGQDYLRTGQDPPLHAQTLARSMGIPTYDFVMMQMEAAGIEVPSNRPKVEQAVDGLDPASRTLLRQNPSLSRTTRTVSQTEGDTKWFLDAVASKESSAHGHYDAMNMGGTGIGVNNRAYGSANSCDKNHGCLSSMTLGQVMALQANGDAFAVGRYQFTPQPLRETIEQMGISLDTPFDAALQDALAIGRLYWRLGVQNSATGLRNEWQGLWKMSDSEVNSLLTTARSIVSPYNDPRNILPALRS